MALELHLLSEIHPIPALLVGYGTSTIFRLSIDPTEVGSGVMSREVRVDWVRKPGGGLPQHFMREISWREVPALILDACLKWKSTKNNQQTTEEAAVGVLAMLIDDLENAEILSVLQIGSGGDFLITIRETSVEIQAECSGILVDEKGYETTQRLKDKGKQVLTKSTSGFASITTFSHSKSQEVRCKISFVGASI